MNKLFLVLMLAVMALGLTACLPEEETPNYIPPYVEPGNTEEPGEEQPVEETPVEETPVEEEEPVDGEPVEEQPVDETPVEEEEPVDGEPVEEQPVDPVDEEPVDEEPTPEVITDKTVKYDKELTINVWETITLDVTGYTQIKITLSGEYIVSGAGADIPVNIDNFVVDGVSVNHSGISGNPYLLNKAFNIGELNAVGHLINAHQGNLRLHTLHATHGTEHFITIDVADINTFEFQYKITTKAFAYLDAIIIDFIV